MFGNDAFFMKAPILIILLVHLPHVYIQPSVYLTELLYDTIEEFNMDSKAECDQLNLAHIARKKKIYKKRN